MFNCISDHLLISPCNNHYKVKQSGQENQSTDHEKKIVLIYDQICPLPTFSWKLIMKASKNFLLASGLEWKSFLVL